LAHFPQKIDGADVRMILLQDFTQQCETFIVLPKPEVGLRFEEACGDRLSLLQVFFEDEHGWQ
jgi:hypothetical protein